MVYKKNRSLACLDVELLHEELGPLLRIVVDVLKHLGDVEPTFPRWYIVRYLGDPLKTPKNWHLGGGGCPQGLIWDLFGPYDAG